MKIVVSNLKWHCRSQYGRACALETKKAQMASEVRTGLAAVTKPKILVQ